MLKSLNIFKGYFRYLRIYRRFMGNNIFVLFVLSLLAVAADSLGIMMILPLLKVSEMTGDRLGEGTTQLLTVTKALGIPQTTMGILVFIGGVFLAKGFIQFANSWFQAYLKTRLQLDLKSKLLMYYTTMKYEFYASKNTGHFINVINQQIPAFVVSFTSFVRFNSLGITTLGYLGFAAMISYHFTGMAVAAGLIVLFMFGGLSKLSRNLSIKLSVEADVLNKFLIQLLQAVKYLSSTSSMEPLSSRALRSIGNVAANSFKQQVAMAFTQAVREPISVWFVIGIIFIQVIIYHASVAPIFIALALFYRAFNSVVAVQSGWQGVMSAVGGLEMTLEEFEQVSQNQELPGRTKIGKFKDKIVFNKVYFAYGAEDVLKDINLTIPLNAAVAIVGESGAGKSTMIDLITLLLKPQSGEITVDGIPHRELDLSDWRQNIGMVTQDTVVFDDTLANNISLWACDYENDEVCRHRIEEAARRAYCLPFINEMSAGYQTIVGDRGIKLSGGQKQRLSIARELFKNPKLLILDEATSSLDTESERYIQKGLEDLKGKVTVVAVAHRLSTIKNADHIYVLDKGRIIEEGSYNKLLERENSRFGRMVALQRL